ncbi:hypothetical protein ACLMJK_008483 [Lecanora helva]
MSQTITSPEYLVTLQADGSWKWKIIPTSLPAVSKVRDDYQAKYNPDTTPAFLVDLGPEYKTQDPSQPWPWKVISVQHLCDDDLTGAEVLLQEGWGAISYAWGECQSWSPFSSPFTPDRDLDLPFLDPPTNKKKYRPVYEGGRKKNDLPLAYVPPGSSPQDVEAWNWGIPKIPAFTVLDIKRVFKTIRRRFIWWDMACLPQMDFSKGFDADPSRNYPGPPRLAEAVTKVAGGELSKQKYVYDRASAGAAWLLTLNWNQGADASKWTSLQKLLTQAPKLLDLATIKTMIKDQKATDPKKRAVWTILQAILGKPGLEDANAWKDAIDRFKALLLAIRNEEAWFRSLWSFQEARLMKNQAFVDKSGNVLPLYQTSALAEQPPFPNTNILVDGIITQASYPSMADIINVATLLASQISLAYNSVYGSGTAGMPLPPLVTLWQPDPKVQGSKPYLEPVLRELTASGLLYNPENAPLEMLLAARRSRFPSLKFADQYFAMTGVLGLVKVDDQHDYSLDTSYDYWYGVNTAVDPNDWTLNKQWLVDGLPKAFFEAIVKRYQWLALLFAKKSVDKVDHWGAIAMGHYEIINPYFEGLFLGNEFMTTEKDWDFELPFLQYDKAKDLLHILPPKEYVTNTVIVGDSITKAITSTDANAIVYPKRKITCWQVTKEWAADLCYLYTVDPATAKDYVEDEFEKDRIKDISSPRPSKPSNNVLVKSFTAADFGGLNKFLLIPFKSLGYGLSSLPNPKIKQDPALGNKRCLVIAGAQRNTSGVAKYDGYFGGIADMRNVSVDEIDTVEIQLCWQKRPDF